TPCIFPSIHKTVTPLITVSPFFFFYSFAPPPHLHSFPTRRSSDLRPRPRIAAWRPDLDRHGEGRGGPPRTRARRRARERRHRPRSEEHTSELQSRGHLVCRLLLEKKKRSKHYNSMFGELRLGT